MSWCQCCPGTFPETDIGIVIYQTQSRHDAGTKTLRLLTRKNQLGVQYTALSWICGDTSGHATPLIKYGPDARGWWEFAHKQSHRHMQS
jgi:hypothetical protein